jgi:hypothetical protein
MNQLKNGKYVYDDMVVWYKNNVFHRDSGLPAIKWKNGSREWWVNGVRHRGVDRPAVIYDYGYEEWWSNGERYRINFPGL